MPVPPPTPDRPPDGARWPGLVGRALGVLVILYLTWRFLSGLDWGSVEDRVEDVDRALVILATLLLVVRFVILDLRWRLAFRRLGTAPNRRQSFFGLLGAVFANHVIPVARVIGGLLRARYGARFGDQSFGVAYGIVLFDQVAHQVVIVTSTVLALAGLVWILEMPLLSLAIVVVLVVASAFWSRWFARRTGEGRWVESIAARMARYGGEVESISRHGRAAVETLMELLRDPVLRRLSVVAGLGFVLLNGLAQWIVFLAIGTPASLLASLMAVALGAAIGGLSGTPGGLGTTEAGMIMTYAALEIAPVDAAAATLLFRGLHYVLVVALGLPAILLFELGPGRGDRLEGPDSEIPS